MRTEEEVIGRLKDVWHKCLDKKKLEYLGCGYKNCVYNIRCRVKGNGNIAFCSHGKNTDIKSKMILVCNNDAIAKSCEYFKCKNTEEKVLNEFRDEVANPSVCGQKYPKLAVLLWFLQKNPTIEINETKNIFERFKSIFK